MDVFTDKNLRSFQFCLPARSLTAFPPSMMEEFEKISWEDMILSMNEVLDHPSIDLASTFLEAREAERPPPLDTSNRIQEILTDTQSEIQALNAKIPQLFATLTSTFRELRQTACHLARKSLQVQTAQYILSPPKQLPHDILEQIFFWSWKSMDLADPKSHRIPLRLATVCHRWRSVALSMPLLWSRVHVDVNKRQSVQLAKMFTSRSHTLWLSFDEMNYGAEPSMEDFVDFLTSSNVHISYLSLPRYRSSEHALQLIQDEIEELILWDRCESLTVSNLLQIRRLFLGDFPSPWKLPSQFPQLHRLRVLYLEPMISIQMFDVVLEQCPQLETLRAEIIPLFRGESLVITHHQVHKALESLAISYKSWGDIPSNLLHNWSFPQLKTFSYHKIQCSTYVLDKWLTSHSFVPQIAHLDLFLNCRDDLSLIQEAPLLESLVVRGMLGIAYTLLELASSYLNFPRLTKIHLITDVGASYARETRARQIHDVYRAFSVHHRDQTFSSCSPLIIVEITRPDSKEDDNNLLPLLARIKDEHPTNDTNIRTRVEVRWIMDYAPQELGRFRPLPFSWQELEYGILTHDGERLTRRGTVDM